MEEKLEPRAAGDAVAATGDATAARDATAAEGDAAAGDSVAAAEGAAATESASAAGDATAAEDAGAHECGCKHKSTPRSSQMQADLQKRLNRVIGQLNGVKSMIEDNRYCGDVLVQLSAAESAIRSVSAIVMRNHLETCVVEQIQEGNTEVIDEVMRLMKRFA